MRWIRYTEMQHLWASVQRTLGRLAYGDAEVQLLSQLTNLLYPYIPVLLGGREGEEPHSGGGSGRFGDGVYVESCWKWRRRMC